MHAEDVIITNDAVEFAGRTTMWTLSGLVECDVLREAWVEANQEEDMLPSETTVQEAMARSAREQRDRHRLVRRVKKGFTIKHEQETAEGDDTNYSTECLVTLNKIGQVEVVVKNEADLDEREQRHVQRVREEITSSFEKHLFSYNTDDVSGFLSRLVRKCRGTAIRPNGGVYFIPAGYSDEWERYCKVIEACTGHSIFNMKSLSKGDDTLRLVLESILKEAATVEEQVRRELDEGGMGAKALHTREGRAADMAAKIAEYEAILDTSLDDIRDKLEGLRASAAEQALAADMDVFNINIPNVAV